jgi:hypothetical protein
LRPPPRTRMPGHAERQLVRLPSSMGAGRRPLCHGRPWSYQFEGWSTKYRLVTAANCWRSPDLTCRNHQQLSRISGIGRARMWCWRGAGRLPVQKGAPELWPECGEPRVSPRSCRVKPHVHPVASAVIRVSGTAGSGTRAARTSHFRPQTSDDLGLLSSRQVVVPGRENFLGRGHACRHSAHSKGVIPLTMRLSQKDSRPRRNDREWSAPRPEGVPAGAFSKPSGQHPSR